MKKGVGTDALKVTLFGYSSVNPTGGGDPNADEASAGVAQLSSDIYSSLYADGIQTNPKMKTQHDAWIAQARAEVGSSINVKGYDNKINEYYNALSANDKAQLNASCGEYSDAAIIVLRGASTSFTAGAAQITENGRELSAGQLALVDTAKELGFKKIIVLINDSTVVELDELKNNADVDAIMVVGEPGASGFNVLGGLLTGEYNPSGRLADTYEVRSEGVV